MTDRNVVHATFDLERSYAAPPARVFQAFSDPVQKKVWFTGLGEADHQLDFRVGGHEHSAGKMPNGADMHYSALYLDIVPDQRIIYAYEMAFGGTRISATLATVELTPTEGGTLLKLTEQSAYLDGFDGPKYWQSGTSSLLDRLASHLKQ